MTVHITDQHLAEAQRAVLGQLASFLIPEAEGMPSAEQVGVHTQWIDVALAARPDLREDLLEAIRLGQCGASAGDTIGLLHAEHSTLFDSLSVLVAGAYLMVPEVRGKIGYPGQESRPVVGDDVPTYIDMLERVVDRGEVFRPTP